MFIICHKVFKMIINRWEISSGFLRLATWISYIQVKRKLIAHSLIVVRLNYGTFGNLIDNKPRGITRRCGALKQINELVLWEPGRPALFIDIEDIRATQPWQTKICSPHFQICVSRIIRNRVGKWKWTNKETKTRKNNSSSMLVAFMLLSLRAKCRYCYFVFRISPELVLYHTVQHTREENVTDPLLD